MSENFKKGFADNEGFKKFGEAFDAKDLETCMSFFHDDFLEIEDMQLLTKDDLRLRLEADINRQNYISWDFELEFYNDSCFIVSSKHKRDGVDYTLRTLSTLKDGLIFRSINHMEAL